MNKYFSLDNRLSTTMNLFKADPVCFGDWATQYLRSKGDIGVLYSLPPGQGRRGEGGLRTRGYFKCGGILKCADLKNFFNPNKETNEDGNIEFNEYSFRTELDSEVSNFQCKPLITVITIVYNGESYLEETITSVINQTYENVEYIIIDGGSTDGTIEIIRKYEYAIDYWVSESDGGIYDAMNKGIDLASGEFINFMNADDYFLDSNCIKMVAASPAISDNSVSLIYGGARIGTANHNFLVSNSLPVVQKQLVFKLPIPHQAQFCRTSEIKFVGKFDTNFKIAADYDLTLRLLSSKNAFFLDGLEIAFMRSGGVSLDPKNALLLFQEYVLVRKKNHIYKFRRNDIIDFIKIRISSFKRRFLAKNFYN